MFGTGFNILSRLLYNVLVARLLGPSQVGIYYLALTVANLVGVAATGGLETTVVRYLAWRRVDSDWGAFRGTLRFALQAVAALALVGGLAILVLAPWVASGIFHKPEATTPLRIMSIFVPFFALESVLLAATQSFKEMKYKAYIESILNPALRIILIVPAFFLHERLLYIMSAYVLSYLVCAYLSYLALRRSVPVRLQAYPARTDYRELLQYSYPLFAFTLLTFLGLYCDSLFVAHFRDSAEMGMYSVCIRLIFVTSFILPVINQVFAPLISELFRREKLAEVNHNFKFFTLWAVQIYVPVILIFLIAPGRILQLFGEGFRVAAPCLVILMVGQFVNNLTGPVGLVLTMAGWTRLQLWNAVAIVGLQSAIAFLLVPKLGMIGAAMANGAAAVIINLVRVHQVWNRLQMHPFSIDLLKPLLAGGAALGVAVPFIREPNLPSVANVGLMFAAIMGVYVGVLWVLGFDPHSRMAWQHVRGSIGRFFAQTAPTDS